MANFQTSVLYVAITVLILFLVLIGVSLVTQNSKQKWPPVVSTCPDYYNVSEDGTTCTGTQYGSTAGNYINNLSFPSTCSTLNLNDDKYKGSQGACNLNKWAMGCNATWAGITYGVKNPCAT